MSHLPALGQLDVPADWNAQAAAQFFAPAAPAVQDPRSRNPSTPPPRTSLVLSRWQGPQAGPTAVLDELLAQLGEGVQGLKIEQRGPLAFADGQPGEACELSFETPGAPRVWQLHAARLDDGVHTHLTASAPLLGNDPRPPLRALVQSFRP